MLLRYIHVVKSHTMDLPRFHVARLLSAFGLALLFCRPALADEISTSRHNYRHYLPAERHVVEVVTPPYSGLFVINGFRFAA
jgi:hypothetical protein